DVRAIEVAGGVFELVRASVAVRVRDVDRPRHRREEARPLLRLARGQREGTLSPPVERAEEREEHMSLLVRLGDLDRGLVRLRAGIPEEDLLPMLAGGHLPEALREARLDVVVEVRAGEVGEVRGLIRDRLD